MAHTFHRLTAHVHWLSPDSATDRPVLGAISGAHGTLVVDAGASPAHARILQNAISAAGLPAPRFLALTHWHWDHSFGVAAWDVPTCSSLATQRIMAELAQLDWSDAALDARVEAGTEIAFCRDMIKLATPRPTCCPCSTASSPWTPSSISSATRTSRSRGRCCWKRRRCWRRSGGRWMN